MLSFIVLIVEKLNIMYHGTLGSSQHKEKEGISLAHETSKLK